MLLGPFKINLLLLRMLISFLFKISTESSSNSWTKEISEALYKLSKMCAFFEWEIRLLDKGVFPVLVVLIVSLFGNWTVVPSVVFFYISKD